MKIKTIDFNKIIFDNDEILECYDYLPPESQAINYADFSQLPPEALTYDFCISLDFKAHYGYFEFGDSGKMFKVPCFSEQDTYEDPELYVAQTGRYRINFDCMIIPKPPRR